MKRYLLLLVFPALLLAGCASNQGGTSDEYQTGFGNSNPPADVSPGPAATPSFRPGMNPDDPRDPHFTNRPLPGDTPANNQP